MVQYSGNKLPNAPPALIPSHGGYQDLQSFQMAEIVHDGTVVFATVSSPPLPDPRPDGPGGAQRKAEYCGG